MSGSTAAERVRVRLADVAREAQLSISTVSMALADHPNISGQTKQRVRRISQQLGYTRAAPAQRRAATLSRLFSLKHFGFMVLGARPDDLTYSGPLYPLTGMLRGVGGRMEVNVVESADVEVEMDAIRQFAGRLSGLFLVGRVQHELVRRLGELNTPCVILNAVIAGPDDLPVRHARVVVPDHVQMGRTPTALLARQGHRRIAFVCGPITPGLMHSQNLMGYRMALLELGLDADERLVQADVASGEAAAEALCALDNPATAYVVAKAQLAGPFLRAMADRDRPVARDACFLISDPGSAQSAGLNDRPRVYCAAEDQAAAGFELLARVLDGSSGDGTVTLVQPRYANLPGDVD